MLPAHQPQRRTCVSKPPARRLTAGGPCPRCAARAPRRSTSPRPAAARPPGRPPVRLPAAASWRACRWPRLHMQRAPTRARSIIFIRRPIRRDDSPRHSRVALGTTRSRRTVQRALSPSVTKTPPRRTFVRPCCGRAAGSGGVWGRWVTVPAPPGAPVSAPGGGAGGGAVAPRVSICGTGASNCGLLGAPRWVSTASMNAARSAAPVITSSVTRIWPAVSLRWSRRVSSMKAGALRPHPAGHGRLARLRQAGPGEPGSVPAVQPAP